jgi:hypothetical protein
MGTATFWTHGGDVIREHWWSPRFWLWWWQRSAPPEVRSVGILGLLILLLGAGWVASGRISQASGSNTSDPVLRETTTVERAVTVPAKATPAGALVHLVTQRVVRYKPTTRIQTQTAVVTQQRVVTNTAVVTQTVEQTVTQTKPETVVRMVRRTITETPPAVTLTETLPPETVIVTVTVKHH